MPKLINPIILTCGCGDPLHLYDEGDQFRFQHGNNPEHSFVGPKYGNELLPAWRKGPDVIVTTDGVSQITISGNWIDSVHARLLGVGGPDGDALSSSDADGLHRA